MSSQQDFIDSIAPGAVKAFHEYGVFASVTIAQAILESGWGKSVLSTKANNYFGIKAAGGWDGEVAQMPTKEVIHGRVIIVRADFRKYDDKEGSILDHAKFLVENPRYDRAFDFNDGIEFARAIHRAGYATDPSYSEKLISIIKKYRLEKYDQRA